MEYVSNILNDPWVNYFPKYLVTIPRRDLDTESLGKLVFYLCKANHQGDLGFNPKSASNSQWPKASQLTSLCLQFLSCKIEVVLIAKALEIIPSFLELKKKGDLQKLWTGTFLSIYKGVLTVEWDHKDEKWWEICNKFIVTVLVQYQKSVLKDTRTLIQLYCF